MSRELPEFTVFEHILTEARKRGHSFEVARGVFKRRMGYDCPYLERESACSSTISAPAAPRPSPSSSPIPRQREASSPIPASAPAATGSGSSSNGARSSSIPATHAGSSIPLALIDFETRSACDITACGAEVYAEHESTDVLCMAYSFGKEHETRLWTPTDGECPSALVAHIAAGGLLEAHNVLFEIAIWTAVCTPRYGWPVVPMEQWRDSKAGCAAMAIPLSLEKAGNAIGAGILKDKLGHAVMMKVSRPRKATKDDASPWHEDAALFEKLYAYCRQDVAAERAIGELVPALSDYETRVWQASNAINRRGIHIDRAGAAAAIRMMGLAEVWYHERVAEATGGVLTGADLGSWQKVLPWCAGRGVALPNYQKGTLAEVVRGDIPDDVRTVLNARLALGRTSTAKFQAMLDRSGKDSRARGTLEYHGANTGRWAGRGIQLQNLPRGGLKPKEVEACLADMAALSLDDFRFLWGDPLAAASQCVRGCLTAAPGKILLACDYSAIEARVCNWLAGQDDVVAVFRAFDAGTGPDAYKVRAAVTYKCRVEDVTYDQRQLGKAQELGCQFGCGAVTFHALATGPQYRCKITEQEAKAAVDEYRETHPMVKGLWYALEAAALGAVRSGSVTSVRDGMIKFRMMGPHLKCRLPSGRLLSYPFAAVEPRMAPWGEMKDAVTFMAEVGDGKVWMRTHTYGGSLCENAVQAIARDLMADAILRAEARGFPIVLTVHDELVSEIDDVPTAATPKEFSALMCELPAWAVGLPVAAAGWTGKRYRK